MRLPNGEVIIHDGQAYDPAKAHAYYLKTRKLKGRKSGAAIPTRLVKGSAPAQTASPGSAKARQKQDLQVRIASLEDKLAKLKDLIKKKESAAKKAAKPAKPDSKAAKARKSKQYRDKHKQQLKTKAKAARKKAGAGGGGSSKGPSSKSTSKPSASGQSLKDLKMLQTKVAGQLSVAKAKLRAL